MRLDSNKVFQPEDCLLLNNKPTEYTMLNFWQLSLSDILLNLNRGTFAEFIVRCAMHENGFDSFLEDNGSLRPYDITGPCIPAYHREAHIEIKSAAYVQENTKGTLEKELDDCRIRFSIKPPKDMSRQGDLYVFCHYKALIPDRRLMLDLSYWDFYVYPTYKIDEDEKLKEKTGISLYKLKKQKAKQSNFTGLYANIMDTITDISNHFSK